MFEALMPPLVVPEEDWGPMSWAVTHPLYVESEIEYGLDEAGYGYWGFSPSSNPAGGYREYGVDYIGMEPNGYTSDVDKLTLVDPGWDDPADVCDRAPSPIDDYGEGVVTPHAAFLALDFDRAATLDNLANLAADFPGLYGRGGFKDAVNVATGQIADRYLALDQGMVIAAIANEITGDRLQDYLAPTLAPSLAPLMAMEEFGAGRIAP
jgi:Putative glucoamylase